MLDLYDDARREIAEKLRLAIRARKGASFQAHQLRAAMAQVEDGIRSLIDKASDQQMRVGLKLNETALAQLSDQIRVLERRFKGGATPLAVDEMQALSRIQEELRPTLLRRFTTSFAVYGAETVRDVERTMALGLATKQPVDEMIDAVGGVTGQLANERWKAERIVRTELNGTYNAAHHEGLLVTKAEDYPDLGKQWSGFADLRECQLCRRLDGTVRRLPDGTWTLRPGVAVAYPPAHPHCFVAETEVEGRFEAGLVARYAGKILQVFTRFGRKLTVTPNHPILTPQGFIPAKDLEQGQQLFGYRHGIDALSAGADQKYDRPARIDQVARALKSNGGSLTRQVDPLDLHGDALFVEPEIEIVGADVELLEDRYTEFPELSSESILMVSAREQAFIARLGSHDLALQCVHSASARSVGGHGLSGDLLRRHGRPLEELRCGAASYFDASRFEVRDQGGPGDADFSAQLFERSAGTIGQDQIVEIRDHEFRGHVYDLQSPFGWIMAQGLVVSNCRCRILPWRKAWGH